MPREAKDRLCGLVKVKVHLVVGVLADEGSQHVFSGRES